MMNGLPDAAIAMRDFFEAGGSVLWVILGVTILMWTLIIERLWYSVLVMPKRLDAVLTEWHARRDTTSWWALRIREQMVSQLLVDARRYMLMINTLMALLPLLGLLGTVTGMIQVFDVIAVLGTGNARAMAGGVSAATIPTMSGLVAALSGLYFASALERRLWLDMQRVEDGMLHNACVSGE